MPAQSSSSLNSTNHSLYEKQTNISTHIRKSNNILRQHNYFWMDTDEKESTFIHGGLLSSVLKSIVALQKLLIIEKHLTTAIGIGTTTRCTASFDWHTIIGSLQDFLWAIWHFVTHKTAKSPVPVFQLHSVST